jgi:hypothetical protein
MFLFSTDPHLLWVHTASYPMGTGGCFPGGNAVKLEADRSFPSSKKFKNV